MNCLQILHTSSAKTGGFGTRAASEGIPQSLINYAKTLAFYKSGKFAIPSAMLVMKDNPEKINEYPVSYSWDTVVDGDKKWYVIGRTVPVCYDYSFYSNGNPTRSGNYVLHLLCFDEYPGNEVFSLISSTRQGKMRFIPSSWEPRVDNEELSNVMLGKESPFTDDVEFSDLPDPESMALDLFFAYREALVDGKPVVVAMSSSKTDVIAQFMGLLPSKVAESATFRVNHQDDAPSRQVKICFVNEWFTLGINKASCSYFDFIKGSRVADDVEKIWRPILERALKEGRREDVKNLSDWIFSPQASDLAGMSAELNESLFNYIHRPSLFSLDLASIPGLFATMSKYLSSGLIEEKLLSELMVERESQLKNSDDVKDYEAFFELTEMLCKVGLKSASNESTAAFTHDLTNFMLSSTDNLVSVFKSFATNSINKYTHSSGYPKVNSLIKQLVSVDWGDSIKDAYIIVSYFCPDVSERVGAVVDELADDPANIDFYKYLLDCDGSEFKKIDALKRFDKHRSNAKFSEFFYNQILRDVIVCDPFPFIEKLACLGDDNPDFAKKLFSGQDIYSSIYKSALSRITLSEKDNYLKVIKKCILDFIPEDLPSKKKWHLLYSVLAVEDPRKDAENYYAIARKLNYIPALKAVAPQCPAFLEGDGVKDFVELCHEYELMTDNNLLSAVRKSRTTEGINFAIEIAKAWEYGFEAASDVMSYFEEDKKSLKKLLKLHFKAERKVYRKEKFKRKIKNIFKSKKARLLILVFSLLATSMEASEYGSNKTICEIRYYVTSGTVSVLNAAQRSARKTATYSAGDYVYVDSSEPLFNDGSYWVKVAGEDKYIMANLLTMDDNPYYVAPDNQQVLQTKKSVIAFGTDEVPTWLAIIMLVLWVVAALIPLYMQFGQDKFDYVYKILNHPQFPGWKKKDGEQEKEKFGYGMQKVFFFRKEPYLLLLNIAGCVFGAFVAVIIVFIAIGGLVWSCCWLGNALIIALYWILTIGGYAYGVVMILGGLFRKEWAMKISISKKRLWSILWGIAFIQLGSFVTEYKYAIYHLGGVVTNFGSYIFDTFNVFSIAWYLIRTNWFIAVLIALTPFVLFLTCAAVYMVFSGCLTLYENSVLRRYNMKNPCPNCHNHSEPAIYYSHGKPLPVPLKPGVWGLFHIVHPVTGEKMPTLFLNGKGDYPRQCHVCSTMINAEVGVECQVAFAGLPGSGKTTLLYRIVAELRRAKVGSTNLFRFTDQVEPSLIEYIDSIADGRKMDYYPDKTDVSRHRSIQMIGVNPHSSFPYRLFLNDVAGEIFTVEQDDESAPFFRNTNVVVLALDPFTMNVSNLDLGDNFKSWYKDKIGDPKESRYRATFSDAVSSLLNTVAHYRAEGFKGITVMPVFVKVDTGYLGNLRGANSEALKDFAVNEMGLGGMIATIEETGCNVVFHSVSAADDANVSGVTQLIKNIFAVMTMPFDKITEKQAIDSKGDFSQKQHLKELEDARYEAMDNKILLSRFKPKWYTGRVSFIAAVATVAIFVTGGLLLRQNIRANNYSLIVADAEQIIAKDKIAWGDAMNVIAAGVENLSLSKLQQQDLSDKYLLLDRERKKYVSKLRSTLYGNFKAESGNYSNIELSIMYGALDNVRKIKKMVDDLSLLEPGDRENEKYKSTLIRLASKYSVEL